MTLPQTLAQKLVAKAAHKPHVAPGEIVTCKVDLAMFHDSSGPRRLAPMLERLGATVWDRDKIVLITDHYVPGWDHDSRKILQITRDWAHIVVHHSASPTGSAASFDKAHRERGWNSGRTSQRGRRYEVAHPLIPAARERAGRVFLQRVEVHDFGNEAPIPDALSS